MKKIFSLFLVLILIVSFAGCAKIYESPEALIDKIREEIPLADAEKTEINYAGMSKSGDFALLWYISGNEHQSHSYFPIECEITDDGEYKFVHSFKIVMDRLSDVGILQWNDGYSFCVNNPNCKAIRITDNSGTYDEIIDSYPYVFYTKGYPSEYIFLDAEGNELR